MVDVSDVALAVGVVGVGAIAGVTATAVVGSFAEEWAEYQRQER